jgi:hydroxyproline O-arabinosyltransferase
MGGYTRVLHGGKPDDLMAEIPTLVVEPMEDPEKTGLTALNRVYALLQWTRLQRVRERNVLIMEPDQLFLRPLPNLMVHG